MASIGFLIENKHLIQGRQKQLNTRSNGSNYGIDLSDALIFVVIQFQFYGLTSHHWSLNAYKKLPFQFMANENENIHQNIIKDWSGSTLILFKDIYMMLSKAVIGNTSL